MTAGRCASAALLVVLVAAKAAMLGGHPIALSWWSPVAYLWHDAAVVLAFAAIEWGLGARRRVVWALYAAATLYVAINIPVAHVLATPLTWPMLRAAGGPLADSMWYYVTWPNALLFAGVAGLAVAAPLVLRRPPRTALSAVLIACVALGPAAAARVDTGGLERNAWTALLPSKGAGKSGDWQVTGFDRTPGTDLSRFHGGAAGRNIVLVSLESTAAQYLGLYGATPDVMPNLSALARESIVFENAYAVYPESIKGLFSILCAAWPAFRSDTERYAAAPCRALPEVLRRAGYRTGLFHSGRFLYLGMEAVIRNRGFDTLEDAGNIGGNHQSSFGVDEPSTVARILAWIDGLPQGQRFFVTYLPIAGHHPYETPEAYETPRGPFADGDEFGRYRNALHYGDRSLGALMKGLCERGLERKTLWIVLGDHGEAFGQHDGNYGHTFHLYEENIHVPLLVAAPGWIGGQVRAAQVASLVDVAPTVLDLAGVDGATYAGRSLLNGESRMALFFADYSLGLLGLRDGPRKFIYEPGSGRAKLFDLGRDPGETVNLAAADVERVKWYERNLRAWVGAQAF